MRVLFLNSVRGESFGGGERWMLTIGTSLAARGHEVSYVGRPGSALLARAGDVGLPVHRMEIRGDADPRTLGRLRRLYRERGIDLVVANFNKDVRLAGLARLPGRRPRVLARNGLAILPDNLRYRLTYRLLADGIVTNTRSIRDRYLGYGWVPPRFVHVVHNGIVPPPPDPRPASEIRVGLGLPEAGPWIGAFGRLVTQKRFDLFLEAAAALAAELPGLGVLLVGDGPERERLLSQARSLGLADRLRMPGFRRELTDWYRACDLVALTSASEGLPNAILESMACGRAVAAFGVGGVEELIPDPEVGRVVPSGDVPSLVREALALLRDDRARAAVGAAAWERARSCFSVERMTDGFEAVMRDLI